MTGSNDFQQSVFDKAVEQAKDQVTRTPHPATFSQQTLRIEREAELAGIPRSQRDEVLLSLEETYKQARHEQRRGRKNTAPGQKTQAGDTKPSNTALADALQAALKTGE